MNTTIFFSQVKIRSLQAKPVAVSYALLIACVTWLPCHGQQKKTETKNPIQLADQYFAAGEYYTAANLYEQYLNSKTQKSSPQFPLNVKDRRHIVTAPGASKYEILYKQAESYRLANYWQQAAASYRKCMGQDPSQNPNALYWYAVCERSLGHYDSARENLNLYLSLPGENKQYGEAAKREQQTLSFIQQQLARPDTILTKVKKINAPDGYERGVFALAHSGGSQFLISTTQPDSVQVAGINPYHSRLYSATFQDGSLNAMTPITLASKAITNQGAASISPDGKYLYFSEWKKERGETVSSIYYSRKQGNGWSTPQLLPYVNLTGFSSKQPFCTTDGKYLFYASDRPGGSGKFDIWYAELKDDGTAGQPVNLGPVINTTEDDEAPFYQTSSSTLVFSSKGLPGMGGFDLFAAKGNEENWKAPENLGHPVNSSRDDIYFFAPENTAILGNAIFSSDRGEGCCLESYSVVKTPKSKKLIGTVRDCKDHAPVPDAQVMVKDASGKSWKLKTNADGKYFVDLGNGNSDNLGFAVSKELYKDTTSRFLMQNIDESDMLTDKLTNADICIEKKPEQKPVLVIKAEDVVTVYFDFDKSNLKSEAIHKLDSIYNILTQLPIATIQISGYTDGIGTDAYNQVLSDKRARACANYLIQKGVEAGRVSFVSFGACCPIEMEKINGRDNPDGRSKNRRALINVKKD